MSALSLRIIACAAMLLDHVGYAFRLEWLRLIGRIAFPLFAYLIYNGYCHTSNKGRYALRLLVFALLSQIPFSLFCYRELWHGGNVFFTLLAALLCLWTADALKRYGLLRFVPAAVVCFGYYIGWYGSDYGATGILLVLLFSLLDRKKPAHLVLLALGMAAAIFDDYLVGWGKFGILALLGREPAMPRLTAWNIKQLCALGALPLIWAYNGEKGRLPRWLPPKIAQYGFYLFYPLHQLVLWLIQ